MLAAFISKLFLVIFLTFSSTKGQKWKLDYYPDDVTFYDSTERIIYDEGQLSFISAIGKLIVVDRLNKTQKQIIIPRQEKLVKGCEGFNSPLCYLNANFLSEYDKNNLIICGFNIKSECYIINKQNYSINNTTSHKFSHTVSSFSKFIQRGDENQMYITTCQKYDCRLVKQTGETMRTKGNNKQYISSDSTFIDMITSSDEKNVYTFYNEPSTAFDRDQFVKNGDEVTYSFVGRICTNDPGINEGGERYFATFAKARLLCAYPGGASTRSQNLYFNILQSIVQVDNDTIIALFKLPKWSGQKASAICSYSIQKLKRLFDGDEFRLKSIDYYDPSKEDLLHYYKVGTITPGQCPSGGSSMIKGTTEPRLIKRIIKPLHNKPIFTKSGEEFDYISAVPSTNNRRNLFLVKRTGEIEKVALDFSQMKGTFLQSSKLDVKKKILKVSATNEGVLLALPSDIVIASLTNCAKYETCESCFSDPNCNWQKSEDNLKCQEVYNKTFLNQLQQSDPTKKCSENPPAPITDLKLESIDPLVLSWKDTETFFARPKPEHYLFELRNMKTNSVVETKFVNTTLYQTDKKLIAGNPYMVTVKGVLNLVLSHPTKNDQFYFNTSISKPQNLTVTMKANSIHVNWISNSNSVRDTILVFDANSILLRNISITGISTIDIYDLVDKMNYTITIYSSSSAGIQSNSTSIQAYLNYELKENHFQNEANQQINEIPNTGNMLLTVLLVMVAVGFLLSSSVLVINSLTLGKEVFTVKESIKVSYRRVASVYFRQVSNSVSNFPKSANSEMD